MFIYHFFNLRSEKEACHVERSLKNNWCRRSESLRWTQDELTDTGRKLRGILSQYPTTGRFPIIFLQNLTEKFSQAHQSLFEFSALIYALCSLRAFGTANFGE